MLRALFDKLFKNKADKVPDPMKYLIVGLGNMHPDYDDTRHNVGFDVVEALAKRHGGQWKNDSLGDLALIKYRGRTLHLLKPSTYMNKSGKAVNYWGNKKKVLVQNLLIITDDKNIDFGALRLRAKGSDGGHNGLKDIQQIIGAKYARLRVGIGNDFPKGRQIDFVLGQWSDTERAILPAILDQACDMTERFTTVGVQQTMNEYNGKRVEPKV